MIDSCKNCASSDSEYCEKENREKYGFCGNWQKIESKDKKTDTLPSCNSCVHNGTWDCITCKGFDRYERGGNK